MCPSYTGFKMIDALSCNSPGYQKPISSLKLISVITKHGCVGPKMYYKDEQDREPSIGNFIYKFHSAHHLKKAVKIVIQRKGTICTGHTRQHSPAGGRSPAHSHAIILLGAGNRRRSWAATASIIQYLNPLGQRLPPPGAPAYRV